MNYDYQMQDEFMIGAIKIKDGLFIGDELAIQDIEFIVTNKVTHIINTAGKQIPNTWEKMGVKYLTFYWVQSDTQILFDPKGQVVQEINNFIDEAQSLGQSCLVHSLRGQSRASCALAAYFMKKFKWTLYQTLEYLNSRRPDLEIRASFFHQLTQLEAKMAKNGEGAVKNTWDDQEDDPENQLLRNTYLNSQNAPLAQYMMNPVAMRNVMSASQYQSNNNQNNSEDSQRKQIVWVDQKTANQQKIFSYIGSNGPINPASQKSAQTLVKSVLKGSSKHYNNQTGQCFENYNQIENNMNNLNNNNNENESESEKRVHHVIPKNQSDKSPLNSRNQNYFSDQTTSSSFNQTNSLTPNRNMENKSSSNTNSSSLKDNKFSIDSREAERRKFGYNANEIMENSRKIMTSGASDSQRSNIKEPIQVNNISGNLIHFTVNNFVTNGAGETQPGKGGGGGGPGLNGTAKQNFFIHENANSLNQDRNENNFMVQSHYVEQKDKQKNYNYQYNYDVDEYGDSNNYENQYSYNNSNNNNNMGKGLEDSQSKQQKQPEMTLGQMLQSPNTNHTDLNFNKVLSQSMNNQIPQSDISLNIKDQQLSFLNSNYLPNKGPIQIENQTYINNQYNNFINPMGQSYDTKATPIQASANILDRPQSASNQTKEKIPGNNYITGMVSNTSNEKQRPSSTGAPRSYSPGNNLNNQSLLNQPPNSITSKPQLIITNSSTKQTGIRYPSPAVTGYKSNKQW